MAKLEALVLLSGPIAVGKTSVRDELLSTYGFDYVRSSAFLKALAEEQGQSDQRASLQDLGDRLDLETDYRWVLDNVARPGIAASPDQKHWLVDAVRKKRQVEHFREAYGARVLHVHLDAPEIVLQQRYASRSSSIRDLTPYQSAVQHENEVASRSLIEIADHVFDTSALTSQEIAEAIVKKLTTLSRRR
ncbi:AAA family ATPase [Aquabacterium sp.]|uniref:AAA family ATPase n=1 Tax=Aquabacterium sp. TaxID=1872578 RepID=UPI003D6CCD8B